MTEIFRGTVDVSDEINVEDERTYVVRRDANGEMELRITWTRWRNSHGHKSIIGIGDERYAGNDQVRQFLHLSLMDAFLDVIDPLPGAA
jgi:hypothetical protein